MNGTICIIGDKELENISSKKYKESYFLTVVSCAYVIMIHDISAVFSMYVHIVIIHQIKA